MTSVRTTLINLFPNGTRGKSGRFRQFPRWPADMFAACAYLLQQSDSYTFLQHYGKGCLGESIEKSRTLLVLIGETWSKMPDLDPEFNQEISKRWEKLISCNANLDSAAPNSAWVRYATELLIISDVASKGIGFYKWQDYSSKNWVSAMYYLLSNGYFTTAELSGALAQNCSKDELFDFAREKINSSEGNESRDAILSACLLVPSSLLCTLPKSRTPSSGCTLRSLTHHLSLHPSAGQLKSKWIIPEVAHSNRSTKFNILIIPYPYQINDNDFSANRKKDKSFGTFRIEQSWLKAPCPNGETVVELVDKLFLSSKKKYGQVDAIVFPELALDDSTYNTVLQHLKEKRQANKLIFIAGVTTEINGKISNVVRCMLINRDGDVGFIQRKHHRWALDRAQIKAYSLESKLNPRYRWWEDIQVDNRELNYFVFRRGSCLTTLICEDLARTDPCQTSIRSVGPNILIALLMDGPQLSGRWPARYAMGLADDPGASVLSVTSLGLIRRSNQNHDKPSTTIGLWRDCISGKSTELSLGFGEHALLLQLESKRQEEETLDGRRDGLSARVWNLSGYKGLP